MTDLLTAGQIQMAMLAKSKQVDEALEEYRSRSIAWAEADKACRVSTNTALLSATGASVGERRARAESAAEEHIFAEKMASALKDSAKEALRARLAQLSALQSIATTIKEEMRLAR